MEKLIVTSDEWQKANEIFPGMFNELGKAILFLNSCPRLRYKIISKLETLMLEGIYVNVDPASTAVLSNAERVRAFGDYEGLSDVMLGIVRLKGRR